MAGVLDSVNQRTQLVGQNRLELLLFRLRSRQRYGINVFKVKEVLQCPPLTAIPQRHRVVRGVAHIRGGTIPILDLSMAIGHQPLDNLENCFVIITEYNRTSQGFLVKGVDRIVNMRWNEIHPPPSGAGHQNYLTAVTEVEDELVEIIDVEKVLAEVAPLPTDISDGVLNDGINEKAVSKHVLIVDDSTIARKQIDKVMKSIGVKTTLLNDGREALDFLKDLADQGKDLTQELLLVISDIEMPEMDGYTLTAEIRNDERLRPLVVMLHTSLSGVFNKAMVEKVGADDFLAKFHPDELAKRVADRIETLTGESPLDDAQ